MNYSNLIKNLDLIFSFFNIKQNNIDLEKIMKLDSKNQEIIFKEDCVKKQDFIKNRFGDLSNSYLFKFFNKLNEISAK